MARPGLYDELVKRSLLDKAWVIVMGDGSDTDKAAQVEVLLAEAGSDFTVSPRAVFIVRHRIERGGEQPPPSPQTPKQLTKGKRPQKTNGRPKGNRKPPPPGPHSTGFKKGNPGGPGAQPGNQQAVKSGERRNPLLHAVSPARVALVAETTDKSPANLMRESIMVHQLAIADMTQEVEAIKVSKQRWWWLGSTYTRQEGDGELMGTGRISQRKRLPREEAMKTMVEARSRVQGKLDSAVEKLHKMLQDSDGARKKGLADVLAAMVADSDNE